MLTSSREEPDINTSYDLGVNAYVVKPVDFEAFMRRSSSVGVFWAVINEHPPLAEADDQGPFMAATPRRL